MRDKAMIQKVFAAIAVSLILFFIAACKPVKDENTIRHFFLCSVKQNMTRP